MTKVASPDPYRLRGGYRVVVGMVIVLTSLFAIVAGGVLPALSAFTHR